MRIAVVLSLVGGSFAVGVLTWPAVAVPARQGVAHAAHRARCSAGSTPAVVRGRVVCLSPRSYCRARNQAVYRRHGFVCRDWRLSYDWARLARPLHIPALTPRSACPATQPSGTLGERGSQATRALAYGPGPAYVALGGEPTSGALLTFVWSPTEAPYFGWYGTKALWTIPRYTGAVLVRGRQLDGDSGLGFDQGPTWSDRVHSALRLEGPENSLHPAATFVRRPGCFAYQVDTLRASYVIVFSAVLG